MKCTVVNGVIMVEKPAGEVKIALTDGRKKSMGRNRCNAGFFGTFDEPGVRFTLPVGHLVCDYKAGEKWTRHYCEERGRFDGTRFRFDGGSWGYMNPLYGKAVSTLVIAGGKASVRVLEHAPELNECQYAIAGIPIMEDGEDVKFKTYVRGQGWDGSSLYATRHVFAGVKEENADTLYLMGLKTTTGNMILSAEAFRKFKKLGFRDVVKLDGGGSFYFNAGGRKWYTAENRRVCTIFEF